MSASFTWRGGSPDEVKDAVRQGIINGLAGVALEMQTQLRLHLSKPGSGRRYRVAKGKKKGRNLRARGIHVASAPGNPPAALNGHLRASWTIVQRGFGTKTIDANKDGQIDGFSSVKGRKTLVTYMLGTNLVYARALEYGFRKLAARPYVRPVVKYVTPKVQDIMQAGMAIALKGKR
jgi:hypothetical protein